MSESFYYVNESKREFFQIGLFGESDSRSAIGRTHFGSRALGLLLLDNQKWSGDSIRLTADYDSLVEYLNIEVDAELLLVKIDGIQSFFEDDSEPPFQVLIRLFDFAAILETEEILNYLNFKYGSKVWKKMYVDYLKKNPGHYTSKVREYSSRRPT